MDTEMMTVKLSVKFKKLLGPFLMLATFNIDDRPSHRTVFAMGRDILSWNVRK